MRILQGILFILLYLSTLSSEVTFAQMIDFKGYFFIQSYRNQKGVVNESVKDVFLKTSKGTFFVKDCNNLLPSANELHLKKVILRGTLEKGPLDFCIDNGMQQSRYGEQIILEEFILESNFSYSLSDGTGNRYILDGSVLKYFPVLKESSSSGMYCGGIQKEKALSQNERILLIRNFRKTLKKTRPVTCEKNRPMGSITIRFSQLGEDKNYCSDKIKIWRHFIEKNENILKNN